MTLSEEAFNYALEFPERYQLAMFKAYVDGAEANQRKADALLELHVKKSKENEARLQAKIEELERKINNGSTNI